MELFIVLTIAGISLVGGWVIGELLDNKRYAMEEKEQQIRQDNKLNCMIAEISVILIEMIENNLIEKESILDVGEIIIKHCYNDIDIENVETLLKLVEIRVNNGLELYNDIR